MAWHGKIEKGIDRGDEQGKPGKPGQKPYSGKAARTPGQGLKKRTCPGKPGRMVTLISRRCGDTRVHGLRN